MYSQYYTNQQQPQQQPTPYQPQSSSYGGQGGQSQYQPNRPHGQGGSSFNQTWKPPSNRVLPQNIANYQVPGQGQMSGNRSQYMDPNRTRPDYSATVLPPMPQNMQYEEWEDWMARHKHLIPFQQLQNYQWHRPSGQQVGFVGYDANLR